MNMWTKTCCKFVLCLVKLELLFSEKEAIVCVFVGNLWKNLCYLRIQINIWSFFPQKMTNYNGCQLKDMHVTSRNPWKKIRAHYVAKAYILTYFYHFM